MMGERDERAPVSVPTGPLALTGPQMPPPEIQAPIVPNAELETADPVIAFGVAITKEEREEGQTWVLKSCKSVVLKGSLLCVLIRGKIIIVLASYKSKLYTKYVSFFSKHFYLTSLLFVSMFTESVLRIHVRQYRPSQVLRLLMTAVARKL